MGDKLLPNPSFIVGRADSNNFQVRFTGKMHGEHNRNGDIRQLKEVIESGKASHEGDAYVMNVDENDFIWFDVGGVIVEAQLQPVPKPVFVPLTETLDFTVLNIFLVMFFHLLAFVLNELYMAA